MKLPSEAASESGFNLHPSIKTLSPIANGKDVRVEAKPVAIGILNWGSNNSSTVTSVPLWLMASMS